MVTCRAICSNVRLVKTAMSGRNDGDASSWKLDVSQTIHPSAVAADRGGPNSVALPVEVTHRFLGRPPFYWPRPGNLWVALSEKWCPNLRQTVGRRAFSDCGSSPARWRF